MALPLDLLQTDWFHAVASANPISYLLQAFRSLLIEGWNVGDLALGFGIAAAILALGMLAAAGALKTRLVRT
jgi:ABC-type multidrug transport system permease subunit